MGMPLNHGEKHFLEEYCKDCAYRSGGTCYRFPPSPIIMTPMKGQEEAVGAARPNVGTWDLCCAEFKAKAVEDAKD